MSRKLLIFIAIVLGVAGVYFWQIKDTSSTSGNWKTYVNDLSSYSQYWFQFSYPRTFFLSAGNNLNQRFYDYHISDKINALNEDLKVSLGNDIYDYRYDNIIRVEIDDPSDPSDPDPGYVSEYDKQIYKDNQNTEDNPIGTVLKSDEYWFEEIIEVNGRKLLRKIYNENPHDDRYWDHVIFHDEKDVQYILSIPFESGVTLEYIKQNERQRLSPVFNQIVSTFKFTK